MNILDLLLGMSHNMPKMLSLEFQSHLILLLVLLNRNPQPNLDKFRTTPGFVVSLIIVWITLLSLLSLLPVSILLIRSSL